MSLSFQDKVFMEGMAKNYKVRIFIIKEMKRLQLEVDRLTEELEAERSRKPVSTECSEQRCAQEDNNHDRTDEIREILLDRLDWKAARSKWLYLGATTIGVICGVSESPSKSDATRIGFVMKALNGGKTKKSAAAGRSLLCPPIK